MRKTAESDVFVRHRPVRYMMRCCILLVVLTTSAGAAVSGNSFPVWTDGSFTLGIKHTPVDVTNTASWNQFFSQPFTNASGAAVVYMLFGTGGTPRLRVDSCKTLFKADEKGLSQLAPGQDGARPSWIAYREWATHCYAGRMVHRMVKSPASSLQGFVLNAHTVGELPVDFYPAISPDEQAVIAKAKSRGKDFGDLLHGAAISYSKTDQIVTIKYPDGGTQVLWLIAKGDYNHDGVCDMLVQSTNQIGGSGTYRAQTLYVVTRKSAKERLVTLKVFSPMSGQPLL